MADELALRRATRERDVDEALAKVAGDVLGPEIAAALRAGAEAERDGASQREALKVAQAELARQHAQTDEAEQVRLTLVALIECVRAGSHFARALTDAAERAAASDQTTAWVRPLNEIADTIALARDTTAATAQAIVSTLDESGAAS